MPKELYDRIGEIELYKYRYPRGKGSKLIMKLESLASVDAPSGRKFLWKFCIPEGTYRLQQAIGENVHVEWSRWNPAGPATVRVLCNGDEGWKLVAEYVTSMWNEEFHFSTSGEEVLSQLFAMWDIRSEVIVTCKLTPPDAFAGIVLLLSEFEKRGVVRCLPHLVSDTEVCWKFNFLSRYKERLIRARVLTKAEEFRLGKIRDHFVLCANPSLRERIGFPVL